MHVLVVVLFVIALVAIVVAGLWTVAVSLSSGTRD
jgi:FtsZ-interacting cell division protein ZipA